MDFIERLRKQIETQQSPNVYDGIDIAEWHIIDDLAESQTGEILAKIQGLIYNWYARKLIAELRLATRADKKVDASIYGGIFEGMANVSIERLGSEAKRRLEDWERENSGASA